MKILAFETSCDETSVAILENNSVLTPMEHPNLSGIPSESHRGSCTEVLSTHNLNFSILSNNVFTQDFHTLYGGVVPELSSRAHIQRLLPLIKDSLKKADLQLKDIDVISATAGPGLIGALLVGFMFGKTLAFSLSKPFIAVNHIEGHIYSGFLADVKPIFPALVLVVSGGHTLLIQVNDFYTFKKLGSTIDDAAGEAFDKVAKLLKLGYPGGPKIQSYSKLGDPNSIKFPVSQLSGRYDFSFSGLKTSVLRYLQNNVPNYTISYKESEFEIDKQIVANVAASFQNTVSKSLTRSIKRVIKDTYEYKGKDFQFKSICLVGGVAANNQIREDIEKLGEEFGLIVSIPPLKFCGDNAAMIGFRALTLAQKKEYSNLDTDCYPSLPEEWGIRTP